jgi:hypothetical protein
MKRLFSLPAVAILLASAVATFAAASGGCSRPAASAETPPGEAPKPEATVVTPPPPATTTAPPATATAAGCTKNEDCHTQSFYCDSCQCLSLAAGQNAPTCGGKQVQCFVDPCMNQKAVCDHGKCAVGAKS